MEKGLAYKYDNPPWQKYQKIVSNSDDYQEWLQVTRKSNGIESYPSKTVHLNRKPTVA
jgi:hypothetical protein